MTAIADVYRELERVDTKCGALAGLTGAGAAYLGTTMTAKTGVLVIVPLSVASVLLAAATVLLLWTLRPRLGPTGFNRWAVCDEDEIAAHLTAELAAEQAVASTGLVDAAALDARTRHAAAELQILSRICLRKNQILRTTITLSVCAVAAIAVAGAAALT
ncbi:Pycsar system effector family protein [Actinomadura sp. 3N407]|uniref:Pycsar system effector family protein n=1 Tax=Actinomadura sp. 3N407 TaxID=3457423 RepID=UPI003FCCD7B5